MLGPEEFQTILHSLSDGLVVTDREERVIHMNPVAEQMLCLPISEAVGQPVGSIVPDKILDSRLHKLREGDEKATLDLQWRCGNGKDRCYRVRLSALQESNEICKGLVLLLEDVTQERELDRMKNEFIATAAHELRTPLTSVIGFTELLLSAEESGAFSTEERREFLELIREKGEGLASLVDNLLDVGSVESGRPFHLERTSWDLQNLLERAVAPYRKASSRHRFEIISPPHPVHVSADRPRMLQALDNVLTNAVKYSPQGGTILVKGEVAGSDVLISVADQGIGMTAEQAGKVFDKFYRADSSTTAVGGIGLGMSIVKGIVEAHGGKVRVDSAPGQGTTVTFSLPLLGEEFVCPLAQSQVMEKSWSAEAVTADPGDGEAGEHEKVVAPPLERRIARLARVVQKLSTAREPEQIMGVVRRAVRELTGADGATFILREGESSYYAAEDSISPLFVGKRFPLNQCIGGWTLLHNAPALIEDISVDERIPKDAYTSTYVRSLATIPVSGTAAPVAAIGAYWATPHKTSETELQLLQMLANTTAIAMERLQEQQTNKGR